MAKDKVIDINQPVSASTEPEPIFKEQIGEVTLTIFPDFMSVYNHYYRTLLRLRGIPQDPTNITPGDRMIKYFLDQPEIRDLPEDQKRETVYNELVIYYESASDATQTDAIVLTMLTKQEFSSEPKPYVYPERRKIPGMIDSPEIPHNLSNLLERRLKQALDIISVTPGGIQKLGDVVKRWAIDIEMEVQKRDEAGFPPK